MNTIKTLPTIDFADNETGCCPRFHPEYWDEKLFTFNTITFAKASSRNIFHIPINLGKVMSQSMRLITKVNAQPKDNYLILSRDISPWKSEHFFAVEKRIPDMEMTSIPGNFLAKVYDSPYKNIPKLISDFQQHALREDIELDEDLFIFYTTCPKCAKYYKHNYIVLFGKVAM